MTSDQLRVRAWQSLQAIALQGVPQNLYLKMRLMPEPSSAVFGMRLRAADDFASGYDLAFHAAERLVRLHGETIYAVDGLDRPFDLEVVLYDDMIDVCIDRRRCIVNRCPELKGDQFFCFAHNADVTFRDIEIRPLKSPIVYESENKNCANPA